MTQVSERARDKGYEHGGKENVHTSKRARTVTALTTGEKESEATNGRGKNSSDKPMCGESESERER